MSCLPDSPFFAKQQKVVLANSGLIDPEKLEDYVAAAATARWPTRCAR
jgi:hypothetical protein